MLALRSAARTCTGEDIVEYKFVLLGVRRDTHRMRYERYCNLFRPV